MAALAQSDAAARSEASVPSVVRKGTADILRQRASLPGKQTSLQSVADGNQQRREGKTKTGGREGGRAEGREEFVLTFVDLSPIVQLCKTSNELNSSSPA